MLKMIKCKNCGSDMETNAKYCLKCGVFNKQKKPFYKKWWFVLIVVFIAIGALSSCGSKDKKTDTSKETTANTDKQETKSEVSTEVKKEEPKKQDTKITYENFLNVKMGQSYDEVKEILGEGNESSSSEISDIKTTIYNWNSKGLGNIIITIQNGEVKGKAQMGLNDNKANITMEQYNKIENGITYEQLKTILGDGQILSETEIMNQKSIMYAYINKNGSNANFTFSNDSMSMKSQFNLK